MNEDQVEVESSNCEKDLGVLVDDKLGFNEHIGEMVNKANRTLGLIKRSFKFLDETSFINLYKTLVRPLVEYASPVWNPHHLYLIKQIESIQRRATKLVSSVNSLTYPERLRQLELPTLEFRI